MKKIPLALLFLIALVCHAAERPNVVLILLDDLGKGWVPPYADRIGVDDIEHEIVNAYQDSRNRGEPIDLQAHIEAARASMPTLSKLAKEGAVFDRVFATAALCAPSRAGLLTGSFTQSWGAYRNIDIDNHGIPEGRVLMSEPLSEAGYRCGMIGKWHVSLKDTKLLERAWVEDLGKELPMPKGYEGLWNQLRVKAQKYGYQSSSIAGQHPLDRGFDYYLGYNSHDSKYFEAAELWENRQLLPKRPKGEFLTDLFNDKSCEFIESSLKEEKPFFLYYAPMTLHGGIVAPPAHYMDAFDTGVQFSNIFAGHLLALDNGIKQIFETLEKYGATDNTIFIFSTDNGGTHYNVPPHNAPNRGGKGTGWMGALNIPFIVWKSDLAQTGVNKEIASLADVMPTVLEAAGLPSPEGIDGKSLWPYLQGEASSGPRESLASASVHSSRWSYSYEAKGEINKRDAGDVPLYAWFLKGDQMLMRTTKVKPGIYENLPDGFPAQTLFFDLTNDPQQRTNLAAQNPETVQTFDRGINEWLSEMGTPISSQKADYKELLRETKY